MPQRYLLGLIRDATPAYAGRRTLLDRLLPDLGHNGVGEMNASVLRDYREAYQNHYLDRLSALHYFYGILHSPELEKYDRLARLPKSRRGDLFIQAGRELSRLHILYEESEPYDGLTEERLTPDLVRIRLEDIPEQATRFRQRLRPTVFSVIRRYDIRPREGGVDLPPEVADLLRRVVTVALRTVEVMDAMPPIDRFDEW
ncbi:hypothetical protein SRB5_54130 [Streptomyces sp. RB5]|uniref:Type ISP restriction-modification enzyme LLaBIII C-terminal specificity domain-containing protein n=1 Tax=Streptomyces smaragdinus TaxID=2585196 RepID=A0A7K0CR57_9ACTN|nr:type ISP restriction/modification enzyme [Streptomyces smaragdinus]MQY15234.1 hypothetical protein [Streptomyces smaragdinus]